VLEPGELRQELVALAERVLKAYSPPPAEPAGSAADGAGAPLPRVPAPVV